MEISSYDIRVFREVVITNNISQAARRIRVSQPAVSATIRKLEAWAGVDLLIRSKKGVQPTRAGKRFFKVSHKLIENFDALRAGLLEDEDEIHGTFRIGVHPSVAIWSLPYFLPGLLQEYPELDIQLVHDLSRNIEEQVINFELDIGIVINTPSHPDITIRKLHTNYMGFWTRKKPTPLQDPSNTDSVVICHRDLHQTQVLLQKVLKQKKIQSSRIMNSSDIRVITDLVSAGTGIGILPSGVVERMAHKSLVEIPDFPKFKDTLSLIYRHDYLTSQAGKRVKDEIVERLRR